MAFKKASHRKVKTGCATCKKRRVKCDEAKPVCGGCERHSLECIFLAPIPALRESSDSISTQPSFSFIDFKLLHQWDVATGESLANTQNLQRAMREVVPLLATNHEFLMHALLALTSIHMAYLRPTEAERWEAQAIHHQNIGLPLYRSALASVSENNCHALYACGHLVTKCAFASPQLRRSLVFTTSVGTAIDFIKLLRGSFSIHDYAYDWLANGPLGFCLEKPLDPNPDFGLNPDDAPLARLLSVLLRDESEDISVCCGALNSLRKLLAMAATPGQTISTKTLVYSWPIQVSQRYLELIKDKKPEAIIVLAHYCVMLKMIDFFWFMKGCAVGILQQCQQSLDQKWHQYIEWPVFLLES